MIAARLIAAPLWLVYILVSLTILSIATGAVWLVTGQATTVYAVWPEW